MEPVWKCGCAHGIKEDPYIAVYRCRFSVAEPGEIPFPVQR